MSSVTARETTPPGLDEEIFLLVDNGPVTTAGVVAVRNLDAQIDGQLSRATGRLLSVGERAELVELTALRGHLLGRVADYERAAALADELVGQAPSDARSFVTRARMRAVFHRFASALADLDTAATLGGDRRDLDAERAAIYQALGRYDEALAIRRLAVDRRADFSALAALAGVYGERGEIDEAERWFRAATRSYRSTSPFPLAILEFQRGQLWIAHDDLRRARAWCEAAVRRLPAYVPAQGHLAELEAAVGETAPAITRLRPLALASDDPDYATQLARILGDAGQTAEAQTWRGTAAARYDDLLARHPAAFADHAAEFWLTIGGDPERALRLAQQNLALRQTPRARALVRRARATRRAHSTATRRIPMSTTTTSQKPHPYRAALEAGDPDALAAALHPDVILDTPGFEAPIRGRDNVLTLFGVLASNIESIEFIDEFWGDGSHALIFRLSVDGSQIDGADYLQLDADGLVKQITISMRPLPYVQVLAERLADTHARLSTIQNP